MQSYFKDYTFRRCQENQRRRILGGENTMKGVAARLTNGLNQGSQAFASDNSGARIVRITTAMGGKTKRGRQQYAKVGDWVKVSVRKGDPKMKGLVFDAVVIRQKKPFRRNTGERVAFQDNAVCLLKDEKGNPK